MTTQDWIYPLLAPLVAGVVCSLILILAGLISGLFKKFSAWLTMHHQAATAVQVANAGQVITSLLTIGANTIAGKIQSGQLDWTNRASWQKEATAEAAVALSRMPEALNYVAPAMSTLVADLMGQVDAQIVASPTLPATGPASGAPSPADAILGAVATIAASKSALETLTPPVASPPVPVVAPVVTPVVVPVPAPAPVAAPTPVLVDPAGVPVAPAAAIPVTA